VRESCLAQLLVIGADMIPDVHGYDGRFMVLVHDQDESIVEHKLLVRNVYIVILRLRLHKRTDGEPYNSNSRFFSIDPPE
jgi:hypothetical protein